MTAIDTTKALHPVLPSTAAEDQFTRHPTPGQVPALGHAASGRVPQSLATPDLLLELAGVTINLADTAELPPGAELSLKLTATAQGAALSMQGAPGTAKLPAVVAQALREVLPKSGSLAALLPSLPSTKSIGIARPATPAHGPLVPGEAQPRAIASDPLPSSIGSSSSTTPVSVVPDALPTSTGPLATAAPPASTDSSGAIRPAATGAGEVAAHIIKAGEDPAIAPSAEYRGGAPASGERQGTLPGLGSSLGRAGPSLVADTLGASLEPEPPSLAPSALAASTPSAQPTAPALTSRVLAQNGAATGDHAATTSAGTTATRFPDKIAEALAVLASQVPDVSMLREPAGVATALQRSGLMLEAHLADPGPGMTAHIEGDLKAALLMLQETVAQERALPVSTRAVEPPTDTVTPTGVEANAALKSLSDTVDGALARISLNQLQLAQAEPSLMSFSVELPVRLGNGAYEPVELIFEREAAAGAGDHAVTTLTLRMRPPELGPITAVLRLRGEHISTELWAESPATRAQLFSERERLSEQLRSAGLDAPTVSVSQQAPARAVRLPQGLVNTTV